MSNPKNDWQIIGNLGQDPEMRFTPNGNPTTTMNVAVSRTFTAGPDKQQKKETDWVTVITWNTLAEACNQHLHKGSRVLCTGRAHLHKWEHNGVPHAQLQMRADNVLFLERKAPGQAEQPEEEGDENETG